MRATSQRSSARCFEGGFCSTGRRGEFCAASGGDIFRAEAALESVRDDPPELGLALEMFSCGFGAMSPGLAAGTQTGCVVPAGLCWEGEVWRGRWGARRGWCQPSCHPAAASQIRAAAVQHCWIIPCWTCWRSLGAAKCQTQPVGLREAGRGQPAEFHVATREGKGEPRATTGGISGGARAGPEPAAVAQGEGPFPLRNILGRRLLWYLVLNAVSPSLSASPRTSQGRCRTHLLAHQVSGSIDL